MNGNLFLILVSIVGWGVGSIFYKIAGQFTHPIILATIATSVPVILLPFAFWFFKVDFQISSQGFLFSLLGGIMMCLANLAFMMALKTGDAGTITAASNVFPAFTLLISVFFLGELLTFTKILGCLLAVISVVLLTWK